MEELVCENCSRSWKRPLVRGRKPRLCPTCLVAPVEHQVIVPNTSSPKRKENTKVAKFPAPTSWSCPSCGASVGVKVNIDYEPTHACQKRLKKIFPLELVR